MRLISILLFCCFLSCSVFAQLVEVPIIGNPILKNYHKNNLPLNFRGGDEQMSTTYVADGETAQVCVDTFSLSGDFMSITCLTCAAANFGTATLNNLCLTYVSDAGNNQVEDLICIEVCTTDSICTQSVFPFQTNMPFALSNNTPFFDDFSYTGPYPDATKWLDNDVFVNNTLAINPPSVGFATFDGIDYTGTPYDGSFGVSDQLTTNFIDLSNISNTLYVSFHLQEKGWGTEPFAGDSLIVEGKLDDGSWVTLEAFQPSTSMANPDRFEPISLAYTNAALFHRNFQLRFKNHSRNQGAIELWHLDYLSIAATQTDGALYDDIAFTTIPTCFLERYASMPWRHFMEDASNEVTDNYQINIANHFASENDVQNTKMNITELTTGQEIADFVLLDGSEFNLPGDTTLFFDKTIPSGVFTTLNSNLLNFPTASTDLIFETTYAYNVGNEQDGVDGILRNDTVKALTHFNNYFAYDDGSAEAALVSQGAGSRVAVQFHANVADTMRAVQFHFPRIYDGTESQLFNVQVYIGELDDDPEYELIFESPYYMDVDYDSLQGFTSYGFRDFLDVPNPILIPAGDFYVGWQQFTDSPNAIPIGLDKNNIDATQYGFYSLASDWLPITPANGVDGAIMIRPVFGDFIQYTSPIIEATLADNEINLFPNPVTNVLNVQNVNGQNADYQIFNANGQLVKNGKLNGTIEMDTLLDGMYFLKVNDEKKGVVTKRFVVLNN